MIIFKILGILVMLAVCMIAIPDASAIQCSEDKNMIESPHGKLACVFDDTLAKLLERGWDVPILDERNVQTDDYTIQDKNMTVGEMIMTSNLDESSETIGFEMMMGSAFKYEYWPKYTFKAPKIVNIGEEFLIDLEYEYVVPDKDAGYDDYEERLEYDDYEQAYPYGDAIHASYSTFITINHEDLFRAEDYTHYDYRPSVITSEGRIDLPFNNTQKLYLQIPVVINEPDPKFPPVGYLSILFYHNVGPNYTFVIDNGTARVYEGDIVGGLSDELLENAPVYVGKQYNSTDILNSPNYIPPEERNGSPPIKEFGEFLLEHYPDANHLELLRPFNDTQEYLDELFAQFPDLNKNSFEPVANFTQQTAHSHSLPPTTFVFGQVIADDPDNVPYYVNDIKICAFDYREIILAGGDALLDNNGNPI